MHNHKHGNMQNNMHNYVDDNEHNENDCVSIELHKNAKLPY